MTLAPEHQKVVDSLKLLVSEELKSVSYKWLAREYSLPGTLAKQLLFAFLEQAKDGAAATYLVAGWEKGPAGTATATAAPQHVVRLVPGARLAEARASLDPVTSVHVYSVAPCQPKDPADVWNADAAQTATLFAGLLKGEANPLADNRCSSVAGPPVAWAGRKAPAPPVAPAPPPAKAAPAGLLKVDPAKPPASTAPQGAAKPCAKKKAVRGGGGGIMSQIAAAAARPKQAAKAAAAEPMEEDDVAPVRRGGGGPATGRARAVVDSSSDEEEGGAGGDDAAPPSPAAAPSPSPSPAAAAKRPTPPGAVKAGAAAGAKKRKVTRTAINAKGEEVTEVVMEDVSEDGEGGAGVENEDADAPAAAAAAATAPSPAAAKGGGGGAKKGGGAAAAKKPSPAGGKKAPGPGQKSLLGFFGKK